MTEKETQGAKKGQLGHSETATPIRASHQEQISFTQSASVRIHVQCSSVSMPNENQQ